MTRWRAKSIKRIFAPQRKWGNDHGGQYWMAAAGRLVACEAKAAVSVLYDEQEQRALRCY